MMKRRAAARPQAAPVPPFRVNGSGGFFYMLKAAFAFFRNPTNLALRRGGGPPQRVGSGASPAPELPLWSKLIPAAPVPLERLRNKKSPPHGGAVLTPCGSGI